MDVITLSLTRTRDCVVKRLPWFSDTLIGIQIGLVKSIFVHLINGFTLKLSIAIHSVIGFKNLEPFNIIKSHLI